MNVPSRGRMKLPSPDELTDEDRESVAKIIHQADGLADQILSVDGFPAIATYRALRGLVALGYGSKLFEPSPRHIEACKRFPALTDLAEWAASDARLEAIREPAA